MMSKGQRSRSHSYKCAAVCRSAQLLRFLVQSRSIQTCLVAATPSSKQFSSRSEIRSHYSGESSRVFVRSKPQQRLAGGNLLRPDQQTRTNASLAKSGSDRSRPRDRIRLGLIPSGETERDQYQSSSRISLRSRSEIFSHVRFV